MVRTKEPKIVDQLRDRCCQMGRSWKTAECYGRWYLDFMRYHWRENGSRPDSWVDPRTMGRAEIEAFLTYLATCRKVAESTQNQALAGLLFVYLHVLKIEITGINALRATRPKFIPTVLSMREILSVLERLSGRNRLVAYLCFGAGCRIGEVFELRVKDVDFENNFIHIRQAKGKKDRIVHLPQAAIPLLRQQIAETKRLHAIDVSKGRARVPLPYAFAKKSPRSAGELGWYWVFSSERYLHDDQRQLYGRWHRDETTFTKPLADAVRSADPPIYKRVTSHALRHSFATHLMNANVPITQIAELMGHNSIETTQIYTHCMERGATSVRSPLDALGLLT